MPQTSKHQRHRLRLGHGTTSSRVSWQTPARPVGPVVQAFEAIKALLKQPVVIDGRNLYEPALMQSLGFEYIGIGRAGMLALTEQVGSRRSPG